MKKILTGLLAIVIAMTGQSTFAAEGAFEDLVTVPWAEEHIYYLTDRSIIRGYSDTEFGPNDKVTREQAAAMIVREHFPNEQYSKLDYVDVSKNNYFYNDIAVATKHGILTGYPDNTFRPKDHLTRAEATKILANTYYPGTVETAPYFQDLSKAPWAEDKINTLALTGIIAGYQDGTFKPNSPVTRAEFAVLLARAIHDPFKLKAHGDEELQVIQLVNEERTKRGLKPLKADPLLGHVAGIKSMDMIYNRYFAHDSPKYGSPFTMMQDFGVEYYGAGENIAAGYFYPEDVMDAWMESPGHKANILSESYTHIAVGLANGGAYEYYWTQMFITKK
ncbi:S-layer homology domain-containing protein [Pseudalkalibacillus sp. SCS-8]|uniref:S-layer homology domain-containing protein n=1 Tax=Pseudalkalibacillus nanhaiensis TaxID=3115291 RepID=UPI0032DACEC2